MGVMKGIRGIGREGKMGKRRGRSLVTKAL